MQTKNKNIVVEKNGSKVITNFENGTLDTETAYICEKGNYMLLTTKKGKVLIKLILNRLTLNREKFLFYFEAYEYDKETKTFNPSKEKRLPVEDYYVDFIKEATGSNPAELITDGIIVTLPFAVTKPKISIDLYRDMMVSVVTGVPKEEIKATGREFSNAFAAVEYLNKNDIPMAIAFPYPNMKSANAMLVRIDGKYYIKIPSTKEVKEGQMAYMVETIYVDTDKRQMLSIKAKELPYDIAPKEVIVEIVKSSYGLTKEENTDAESEVKQF